jgi:hypothetical protein
LSRVAAVAGKLARGSTEAPTHLGSATLDHIRSFRILHDYKSGYGNMNLVLYYNTELRRCASDGGEG